LKQDKAGIVAGVERIRNLESYMGTSNHFLHFYIWTAPVQPAFHYGRTDTFIHGFPYTDLLNPKAVKRFIQLTYEAYRKAIGNEFGKTVKGAFSDIPVYHWHYATPRPSIPWTTSLTRIFKKTFHYDLVPHLPSLFFDTGEYSKIRQDFWQLVNSLFLNSYTVQLAKWCARNKLKYTAHYWGEETLHWQIPWTGDVMTHFEKQHVVSIDHILRNIEDPLGVKQAASVAEQFGKPRLISETYALSGHDLTFEERKWIGDWEYALGVNCLVPYIPAYSMRGRRKRDEPPSEFFQQPYWHHEKSINDYYGRLSYILTRGRRLVDILVLQPLNSARVLYKPSIAEPAAYRPHPDRFEGAGISLYQYSQKFIELCERMLRLHFDYHLGNEELLARNARVKGSQLVVGDMKYSLVIVPPSINWSVQTIELLNNFIKQGGRVIAIKPLPSLVNGEDNGQQLSDSITILDNDLDQLAKAVLSNVVPDIEIENGEGLLYQHRILENSDIYFIANTSREASYLNTRIKLRGGGKLELWDAFTDGRYALPADKEGSDLVFHLDFHPAASFLLVRRKEKTDQRLQPYQPLPHNFAKLVELEEPWQFERKDLNALTLDYCEIDVEGTGWTPRLPVWEAHRILQQAGVGARFDSRFRFNITDKPKSLYLAVERPSAYTISINGRPLPENDSGGWWDASIRIFDISFLAHCRENTIEVAGMVGADFEFENVYVLGDFALQLNDEFVIVKEPDVVKAVNLVHEGYPFFTGRFLLRRSLNIPAQSERIYLKCDEVKAIVAQVRLNGTHVTDFCWKPYVTELTKYIRAGQNLLEIELCTSLHNLLGPHHIKQGEARHFVLEHSWADKVNWTDNYFFVPVGITGATLGYVR
jgi:hypothetical protein